MIYCSVKYCCPYIYILLILEVHFEPLEVWVRGLYNSWWFCVHKLSMFIYLSMVLRQSDPSSNDLKLYYVEVCLQQTCKFFI